MVIDSITLIFEAADTDGSGELSRDEFDEALEKGGPQVVASYLVRQAPRSLHRAFRSICPNKRTLSDVQFLY